MKNEIPGCLGTLSIMMIVSIIGIFIGGWAFMTLWDWFVVPVFELPNLTLLQSIGLVLIITFFHRPPVQEQEVKKSSIIGHAIGTVIISPLLFITIGWIILWIAR